MSGSAFPPPPGSVSPPPSTPIPPTSKLPARSIDERIALRPPWRQGRVGWVLVQIVIAWGIAIGGWVLWSIVGEIAGQGDPFSTAPTQDDERAAALLAIAFLLYGAASLVGWLCFAYLEAPLQRRWAVFLAITGGAWVLGLAIVFAALDA